MMRKSEKKWFAKKKRSTAPPLALDTTGALHAAFKKHELETYPDDSESVAVFRQAFIEKFLGFKEETDLLVNGVADISDTWTDILGANGIGLAGGVVAGIIGLLGGLLILSAGATAGISIAVAVVGAVAAVAFIKIREKIRQDRLDRASAAMDRDNFEDEVKAIAQKLIDLYRLQLDSCTVKDADALADACMNAIRAQMKRNDEFVFDELLFTPSLQGVLMRAGNRLPKLRLDMNLLSDKKYNTRGMVRHTAYYCKETDEFFKTPQSKGRKYGVLYFDRKTDLEEYQAFLASSMKKPEKWKFTKMRKYESSILKRSSLFKAYDEPMDFNKSPEVQFERNSVKLA